MNRLKGFSASAELAVCCVVLLLAVALSVPLWLGFIGTVQAKPASGLTGGVAWNGGSAPTPTPTPTIVSQGWQAHNVSSWHTDKIWGKGVTIGIIDDGFIGYSTVGKELPTPAYARCYAAGVTSHTSTLATCRTKSSHGTAVAEVIADIAPEATLYIANTGGHYTPERMKSTVSDMAANGVQVINYSVGHHAEAPGDGTSGRPVARNHLLDVINYAVSEGIVWVNSAGNDAQRVWYGALNTVQEDDDWHRFPKPSLTNNFSLKAGTTVSISLRWDDTWGGADCDLDVFLYRRGLSKSVDSSADPQTGRSSHNPFEYLEYDVPSDGNYFVSIWRDTCSNANAPDWIQLLVRGRNPRGGYAILEQYSADHHIVVPAESNNAGILTVGAASHSTPTAIENYSSQGPAVLPPPSTAMPNGRIKPDIVGAAQVRTKTDSSFAGTSAAAPHLAGMAALVIDRYDTVWGNNYTPEDVVNYLKDNASPRTSIVPNNTWGHGFAMLPHPAPTAQLSRSITSIQKEAVTSVDFTTNLTAPDGIRIEASNDKLAIHTTCNAADKRKAKVAPNDSFNIRGCSAGKVQLRLYKKQTDVLLSVYDIEVTAKQLSAEPNPNPPATTTGPRPPTNLALSAVAGNNSRLQLNYTRSESPHRYQFELHYLNKITGRYVNYRSELDSRPPETFKNVGRGYWYKARGRNCRNSSQDDTCGSWSSWSPLIEFSNPQAALSGLASRLTVGAKDYFSIASTDLTEDEPYTVTLSSSSAGIGFDSKCSQNDSSSFTPIVNDGHTVRFTLHVCDATRGIVTARLRKGNARGTVVDTATASVTVNHDAALSPVPDKITFGDTYEYTLFTTATSTDVWVNKSGDTGNISLTTTCNAATDSKAAYVGGNIIAVKGCAAGRATLRLYVADKLLKTYGITIEPITASLSPEPTTIDSGNSVEYQLFTNATSTAITVKANKSSDVGNVSLNSDCPGGIDSTATYIKGNTVTIKGCAPGAATLSLVLSSNAALRSYSVTVR